jgi:PleD family two-component response regulator
MPTTWLDQSLIAIDRLKHRLYDFDWSEVAQDLRVTFCTGLSSNAPGDTAEMIVSRITEALAQARKRGGDQVVQIDPEIPDYRGCDEE